ncbi:MAG: hypothetical protein WCL51_18310 [Bacteroidota bacterium]
MEPDLNEDELAQICASMRLIDYLESLKGQIENDPNVMNPLTKLKACVKEQLDKLTDEQVNEVLEVHKLQKEYIDEELKKEFEDLEKE